MRLPIDIQEKLGIIASYSSEWPIEFAKFMESKGYTVLKDEKKLLIEEDEYLNDWLAQQEIKSILCNIDLKIMELVKKLDDVKKKEK